VLGLAVALTAMLAACTASGGAQPSADYREGYRLGLEAYTYGLPLMVTDATYRTMTSVNVSTGAFGPLNRFNHVRGGNKAGNATVVAAGSSSLSSIAWLDLRSEPQVLHVPAVAGHHFVLALIDPYTENVANLGSAAGTAPGDYVIAGPGQSAVRLPAGTRRLDVAYSRIWVIGSTQLKGPSDVAGVNKIQDTYTLTALTRYGAAHTPPAPSRPSTAVTTYRVPTGLAFFDALGQQLADFPPPARDEAELQRLAEVGIGPGLTPSTDPKLSKDTLRGLADAAAAAPAQIRTDTRELFASRAPRNNGYLLGGFGRYGTDYALRAAISQVGLGAFVPQQTIYAMAWSDHDGAPLTGSTPYVLHLQTAPPAREGWSLTVYDLHGAMVANSLDRYAFNASSRLTRNPDGSIDIYLQSTEPTSPARARNWLPTPEGQGFEVLWRLYAPVQGRIGGILDGSGWQAPAIRPRSRS